MLNSKAAVADSETAALNLERSFWSLNRKFQSPHQWFRTWTRLFALRKHLAISILYPHRKFWRSLYGTNFLEISNGRKTVRMAPILTIFGPNESQRCQLNFEKNLGRRKNFREGEKFEKLSRKVRKILPCTRFLGRNKIETFRYWRW